MARSTATMAREAVDAAKQGADDRVLQAMLESAAQQDQAQRTMLYVVAGLLGASMVVNVVLVAWVLDRSLSIDAFGVSVDAATPAETASP